MKHAFLITAYTDAAQLKDLVQSLQNENSVFYIHLDKKSPVKNDEGIILLKKISNVFFIENPVKVYWAGFSHLKAILLLMGAASKNKEVSYLHLLSGQCFPVKSIAEIQKFFIENKGKEFITCAPLDSMNWSGGSFNRLQLYHLNDRFNIRVKFWKRVNSRFLQLQRAFAVKRKLNPAFKNYFGGDTWWSISAEAAKHIVFSIENANALLQSLKKTHCAEEIIFQTILMNSGFKDNIVNENLRYVDWSTRDGICPVILDERDFESIKNSQKLFARKFVSGISDDLKNKLRR